MIINKFISVKSILEDILRETQSELPLSFEDCVYYVYEALGIMDQPLQFIKKVTGHVANPDLDITNYRAEMPCDVYRVEKIAVNGFPARYAGGSFHHLLSGECCDVAGSTSTDIFTDSFGNQFSPQQSASLGTALLDSYTFDINNNYLTLSTQTGKVCMAYLAFPTDKDGFPMIPDDINYKVACKKYLIMKIRYIDWSKDPSNSGKRALFTYDEGEWLWYVGKATNKAKMPDIHQMENLKNQIIRLIPNINAFDSHFSTLGSKQQIKIH